MLHNTLPHVQNIDRRFKPSHDQDKELLTIIIPFGETATLDYQTLQHFQNIRIEGDGILNITGAIHLKYLHVTGGATVNALNGATIGRMAVDDFATLNVFGHFELGHHVVTDVGDVSFLPGSNWLSGGTVTHMPPAPPCFLTGSMVLTVDGPKAVEDIVVGDRLVTTVGSRPVTWVGKGHADGPVSETGPVQYSPTQSWPVVIRQGAFGAGLPDADLRMTADHAVVMGGKLIPVRLLVNGHTVVYDTQLGSYDYYHIKLEEHQIISVNGVQTESYHDTGHDTWFVGQEDGRGERHRLEATALPFTTDAAFVRQCRASLEIPEEAIPLCDRPAYVDPILTDLDGNALPIVNKSDAVRTVTVRVPAGTRHIAVHCQSVCPAAADPTVDDRRTLGIQAQFWAVTSDLHHDELSQFVPKSKVGWHPDGWSQSEAIIDLPMGTTHVGMKITNDAYRNIYSDHQ